jgi:hypothetical protein
VSGKALAAGFSASPEPVAGVIPLSCFFADPNGSCRLTGWAEAGLLPDMDLGKADGRVIWGTGLVPFPVHEFHANSMKWADVETEVSRSNFIFAAKNIVCYPPVPPAVKNEI